MIDHDIGGLFDCHNVGGLLAHCNNEWHRFDDDEVLICHDAGGLFDCQDVGGLWTYHNNGRHGLG